MLEFVRNVAWFVPISGSVLEIGSYIEVNQEHLDLRRAFPPGTPYLGVDVLEGSGVNRQMDLLDPVQVSAAVEASSPNIVLCLYVIEHVWDISGAARALGNIWRKNPESWLWVATHQNQPYHGTEKYPDYWRLTASGLRYLMREAGLDDPKVFVLGNTSNPEDIVAIQQPRSMSWPGEAFSKTVRAVEPTHWEQYS